MPDILKDTRYYEYGDNKNEQAFPGLLGKDQGKPVLSSFLEVEFLEPNILRTLSYGMYAIGVKGDNGPSACIVNTVMQVTNTAPLMITLSMSRDNYSCECIKKNKLFTVAVLSEDTSGAVVGALGFTSGKNGGKLTNIRHKVLREGVPVIREDICCWFLCRMVDCMESSTHTLFLAEIVAGSEHTPP